MTRQEIEKIISDITGVVPVVSKSIDAPNAWDVNLMIWIITPALLDRIQRYGIQIKNIYVEGFKICLEIFA